MDTETQRQLFADATAALGGQQATARALDMSDRSVRMILAGERRLHDGILEDMANALIVHADHCRALERRLSPAFSSNMNENNHPPLHDGKGAANRRIPKAQVDGMARRLGLKPTSARD